MSEPVYDWTGIFEDDPQETKGGEVSPYPLGDPDLIAADTIANGYLTADSDGVTLARAYLALKASAPVPFCRRHWSWLCGLGQGKCQSSDASQTSAGVDAPPKERAPEVSAHSSEVHP